MKHVLLEIKTTTANLRLTHGLQSKDYSSCVSLPDGIYLPSLCAAPPSVTVFTKMPSFSRPMSAPAPIPMMLMPRPSPSRREMGKPHQLLASGQFDVLCCHVFVSQAWTETVGGKHVFDFIFMSSLLGIYIFGYNLQRLFGLFSEKCDGKTGFDLWTIRIHLGEEV